MPSTYSELSAVTRRSAAEFTRAEAGRIYEGVSEWLSDTYLADVLAPYRRNMPFCTGGWAQRRRGGYPALPFLECVDAFPELTGMDQ